MQTRPSPPSRALWAFATALVLAGALLAAPWQLIDTDTLSRLAVGRTIVAHGGPPTTDPLTFSAPDARWCNPEWLGDLLWYGAHRAGGAAGLIALELLLVAAALLLTLQLGRRLGAHPLILAALVLLGLFGAVNRLGVRNHLHAYWLIPAFGLVLWRARRDGARWLLPLIPLGVLWGNLHSSFVLGWVVIGAATAHALLIREHRAPDARPPTRALLGLTLLYPALAFVSPHGLHALDQLRDHLLGAPIYRQLIIEWTAPGDANALLIQLPVHLLGIIGLLSFLPRANRREVERLLLLAAGLALAHRALRFAPLLIFLATPGIAANLGSILDAIGRQRRATVALATVAVLLLAASGWAGHALQQAPLDRRPGATAPARFLARHTVAGTRLFNPYNAGPYLLWEAAPPLRIYIDPRNNLGAERLRRYFSELLPHADRFETEVRRLHIDLAMVDQADGAMATLGQHLARSPDWRLTYVDGEHAIYVHRAARQGQRYPRYRALRASRALEYLASVPADDLERDLARLRREGAALADTIAAYRLLARSAPPPSIARSAANAAATRRAATLLERALPRLPPSDAQLSYLATAWCRLGRTQRCRELLRSSLATFPRSAHLLGLRRALAAAGRHSPR